MCQEHALQQLRAFHKSLLFQEDDHGINGEALQDGSQEEGRRFQQLRLKLKMANN